MEENIVKKFKANIGKYYLISFFRAFIFAYVIERIFQQSRGLSVTQMVFLDIIFFVVVLVLEVPSGALADRWSRKNVLIIGIFFAFFEFLVPIFAYNFWVFAIASVTAAVGIALKSGTANALIYDSLKTINKEKDFEKFLSREKFIHYLGNGIAILLGGLIAYYSSLVNAYWFSLLSIPIAFLIALTLHEPKIHTTTEEVNYWHHIKDAGKFILNSKNLRFIILYGVITGAVLVELDEYSQLFFQSISLPLLFFGVITSMRLLLEGSGGFIAYRLKNKIKLDTALMIILMLAITFVFLSAYMKSLISLIPLLLAFFAMGIISPLVLGYVHHHVDSKHRATVESFQSLLLNGFSILVGLSFAYVSDHISIFGGYALLGSILFVYLLYFVIRKPKSLDEVETEKV
ncbi:MAG: MFS transporter [Candidatus Woesearchaeota archaeon]|jgi:MFS family permease